MPCFAWFHLPLSSYPRDVQAIRRHYLIRDYSGVCLIARQSGTRWELSYVSQRQEVIPGLRSLDSLIQSKKGIHHMSANTVVLTLHFCLPKWRLDLLDGDIFQMDSEKQRKILCGLTRGKWTFAMELSSRSVITVNRCSNADETDDVRYPVHQQHLPDAACQ